MRGERTSEATFSTLRVVGIWNEVPEEIGEAGAVTAFNRHLDKYIDRKGLEGYGTSVDGATWSARTVWAAGLVSLLEFLYDLISTLNDALWLCPEGGESVEFIATDDGGGQVIGYF